MTKSVTLKDVYDDLVNSNLKRIQSGDELGAARVRKQAKVNAPHVLRVLQQMGLGQREIP